MSKTVRVSLTTKYFRRHAFILQHGMYFQPLSECCGDYIQVWGGVDRCRRYHCHREFPPYSQPLPKLLESDDFTSFLLDYLENPLLGELAASALRDYLAPLNSVINDEQALLRHLVRMETLEVHE